MTCNPVSQKITDSQVHLYKFLNSFSEKNKLQGRLCSIPVSIIDISLDISKTLVIAIEELFQALIHLIEAMSLSSVFSETRSLPGLSQQRSSSSELKKTLLHTENALLKNVQIPLKIAIAPVKIFFQFLAIAIDPETVEPFSKNSFFKDNQNPSFRYS